MSAYQSWFGWPDGGVLQNMVAWAIPSVPAFLWHHWQVKRHITEETRKQTEELKNHIDQKK